MSTFTPDEEFARLAPACVCNVASRVLWLRQKLDDPNNKFDAKTRALLQPFVAPLPFEKELLSGKMDQVEVAVKRIGAGAMNEAHLNSVDDCDS